MNPNFSLESAAEKIEPSLKVLQVQYREIIEKYQPVLDHAHAQLAYIDGILSGFSTLPVSTPAKSAPIKLENKLENSPEQAEAPKAVVTAKATRKAPKADTSPKSLQFLSKYTGETLSSAVGKILNDRRGKEVGIEEVVSALYGRIDSEQFKVAKDRVTKNLSKGKVNGLWNRVPDKSGFYTAK